MTQEHLDALKTEAREALERCYRGDMHLFRENLALMGYTLVILRKENVPVDKELFTSHPLTKVI